MAHEERLEHLFEINWPPCNDQDEICEIIMDTGKSKEISLLSMSPETSLLGGLLMAEVDRKVDRMPLAQQLVGEQ